VIGPSERTLAVSSGPRSLHIISRGSGKPAKHLRDWNLYQLAAQVAQEQAQSNRVTERCQWEFRPGEQPSPRL